MSSLIPNIPWISNSGDSKDQSAEGGSPKSKPSEQQTSEASKTESKPTGYSSYVPNVPWFSSSELAKGKPTEEKAEDHGAQAAPEYEAADGEEHKSFAEKSSEVKSKLENSHGEKEQSLTTVLDADQRGEVTILIANVTASMRKTLESNFDASAMLSPDFIQEFASEDDKILNVCVHNLTSHCCLANICAAEHRYRKCRC